jgi:hypothetical protein
MHLSELGAPEVNAIQICLLIIGVWHQLVDTEKLVKIIETIHVTLQFHPPVFFILFISDFIWSAKTTFCIAVLDSHRHDGFS